jgi:heme-degrading monooxygenase HmoA
LLPDPPYYAVIFTSRLRTAGDSDYDATAAEMEQLARTMPGYLGFESARESGLGIAVSYWDSLEAIERWRDDEAHAAARARGRSHWYAHFDLRVTKIERQYSWTFRDEETDTPAYEDDKQTS